MGNCFIGQQNTRSLLLLVLTPQCVYLSVGMIFLVLGITPFLSKSQQLPVMSNSVLNTSHPINPLVCQRKATSFTKMHQKQKITLIRIGVFAYFYAMSMICITSVTFYEWWGRDSWLRTREPSNIPRIPSRPQFHLFIVKLVVFLSAGATAAAWIWLPTVLHVWKKMPLSYCNKGSNNHKYHTHGLLPIMHSYQSNRSIRSMTLCQLHHHLNRDLTGLTSLVEQHYSVVGPAGNIPRRNHKMRSNPRRKYRCGSETQV